MSGKLLERGAHKRGRRPFGLFRDEDGFTTVGVALALLVTLALVFTSAQVYRVSSASADVQDVADAAALAAENEVAEFMIAVRVCDAVVLSLSLTGAATAGLGVAALCTPATAGASEVLLKAARNVVEARDEFAEKAAAGLNRLQKALPFLAAANAASTASANDGGPMGASYVALAVLVPADGEELGVGAVEGAEGLVDDAEREADGIRQAAADAEEAAREANAWKERAFLRDCGDDPSYCMSERARTLAGMAGADNPRYASVDAWSFSVDVYKRQEAALGLDALKEQVQAIVSADEVAALQAENPGRARSEVRSACRRVFEGLAWAGVAVEQRARLEGELLDAVFGFGPLEGLLADDAVTEIMVNGPQSVFFELSLIHI